jgi:hypothetical protein
MSRERSQNWCKVFDKTLGVYSNCYVLDRHYPNFNMKRRIMKTTTFLAVSILVTTMSLACGGGNTSHNGNHSNMSAATATPTPIPANTDPALKTNIENELRKKGFNNVTVDVTTTPATLRGTYPKGRLAEVIQTAQVANGMKPVRYDMSEENK